MPETPTKESAHTTAAPTSPDANQECNTCHSLRGAAPEGLYDFHTAFGTSFQAGDPKWQMDYCWHCGAKY